MTSQTDFTVARPKLPEYLPSAQPPATLRDDDRYADRSIERGIFSGAVRRLNLERVRLRGVRFEAMLPASELTDVLFESCDLSNVDFSDAILLRVAFVNCRMMGLNLSGAVLKDTSFADCIAQYANFRFARFDRAAFAGCGCNRADFAQANFGKVSFEHTDLRQVQMSGVSLAGVDLTGCDIDGLGARPEDLRGVVLSAEQAVTAAKILGVTIRF